MKILSKKNILIASLQPWYSPMVSKHYITLELAAFQNNMVFLELQRIIRRKFQNRHNKRFKFHNIKHERVTNKKLNVWPGFLRNSVLYGLAVQSLRKTLGHNYCPDIIFSFDPQFYILHEVFSNALRIYYCVDHVASNKILEQAQQKILSNCDIVIVSSRGLYNDLKGKHPNVNYVPHGYSLLEEYEDLALKKKIEKWFSDQGKKYIIGFLGCLNSQIDFKLIEDIANNNPQALVALIGPYSSDVKGKLTRLPENVFCPGPIPSIGIKYCLVHFDVGIVPYRNNQYNLRRNPIKIMQYIANGLPVVSTVVGEDFAENSFVYQCVTRQDFNQKLKAVLKNNSKQPEQEKLRCKERNSWRKKIEVLDSLLMRAQKHNEVEVFRV